MTYTSDRPITVDGVRLDTLAWNITRISRSVASRRTADVEVPGVDGVLPSLNDALEPALFGLDMFVRGTDEDGAVPGVGSRTAFQNNLDELVHLFGKRHGLLEVRETVAVGVERRAWAKVVDTITPEVNEAGSVGLFTVGMSLPYGVWEDLATADWTSANYASGGPQEVASLQGGTERVTDAILMVEGPAVNPRLTDPTTGSFVQLNGTLAVDELWRIDCATWSSRRGVASLSDDTGGTDAQAITTSGGAVNSGAFLTLTPTRSGGFRKVFLTLSGTGFSATRVHVRARRKYAL